MEWQNDYRTLGQCDEDEDDDYDYDDYLSRYEVCRVPLIIAPNVPSIRGELALQCVAHPPKKSRAFLYNTTHDTNIDFNMAHLVLLLTLWYILKFRVFNLGFLPFNFEGRAKSQESP